MINSEIHQAKILPIFNKKSTEMKNIFDISIMIKKVCVFLLNARLEGNTFRRIIKYQRLHNFT